MRKLTAKQGAKTVNDILLNSIQIATLRAMVDKTAATAEVSPDDCIAQAELMGSRGRARMYGREEPEGRDHDYVVFTDDQKRQEELRNLLVGLNVEKGYRLIERDGGFLTAQGNNTDLSFYPESKRKDILAAWELMEAGMPKIDAWAQVNAQSKEAATPTDEDDPGVTAWKTWQTADTPENRFAVISAARPVIQDAVKFHTSSTAAPALRTGEVVLGSNLHKYDPTKGSFKNFVFNELTTMRRLMNQQAPGVNIPERHVLQRRNMDRLISEYEAEYGDQPDDDYIMDRLGLTPKALTVLRKTNAPINAGRVDQDGENSRTLADMGFRSMQDMAQHRDEFALEVAYDGLSPMDKKILAHSFGLHGHKVLSDKEIARKLGRSQGLISQRKKVIQKILDDLGRE